jgi:DNA-binding IclR family transcriptional regulator
MARRASLSLGHGGAQDPYHGSMPRQPPLGSTNRAAPGVVAKVMAILEAFGDQRHALRLNQITAHTGLPTSTCHRLLGEMVDAGLLDRDLDGRYSVGRRLWPAAMTTPLQRSLRDVAVPFMQDLLHATGQVVNLFVVENDQALVLERISGTSVGKPINRSGTRLPLHTSAGGKILLAYASEDLIDRILNNLFSETPSSITDPHRLRQELALIRQRGWAYSHGEHHSDTWGLSVPVRDPQDHVKAALGVVTFREPEAPKPLLSALQVVATSISRQLRTQL